jgi:hypothetical protein
MSPLDEVKQWYDRDGAVLIRVEFFDEDGVSIASHGTDHVVTELEVLPHAVGWISTEDVKPHGYPADQVSVFGDEVTLTGKGKLYRIVLSPMWTAEQRTAAKDFRARGVVPEKMRDDMRAAALDENRP